MRRRCRFLLDLFTMFLFFLFIPVSQRHCFFFTWQADKRAGKREQKLKKKRTKRGVRNAKSREGNYDAKFVWHYNLANWTLVNRWGSNSEARVKDSFGRLQGRPDRRRGHEMHCMKTKASSSDGPGSSWI